MILTRTDEEEEEIENYFINSKAISLFFESRVWRRAELWLLHSKDGKENFKRKWQYRLGDGLVVKDPKMGEWL